MIHQHGVGVLHFRKTPLCLGFGPTWIPRPGASLGQDRSVLFPSLAFSGFHDTAALCIIILFGTKARRNWEKNEKSVKVKKKTYNPA